jgi:molecular chaperone GrpE
VICELPVELTKEQKHTQAEKALDFIEQFRSQTDELVKQKEQSDKKAAEYLDRLQHLQADIENLQKMAKRQIDSVTRQASEGLLLKLLPSLDALQQATKMTQNGNSLSPEEISAGLEMLLKQLLEVLKGEGLNEVPALGESLNPQRHEVISFVETSDVPENTVVEEVRKGYLLNGRVIRPSLVVVSRPKPLEHREVGETDGGTSP